jgi:pyruvate dehydrogenase E1 component
MGLGPILGIYQAHVMRYLSSRGLVPRNDRKVWVFCGDGEMDEPESKGAIGLAGREQLENLIFVVNCNLQRLDGPVRGNGKIIQELEGSFRGEGWNVIKVVWGRFWDPIMAKDTEGKLQDLMDVVVDGELQNFKAKGGAYTRENFFAKDPSVLEIVKDLTDDDIYKLNRGGHDPYKVYAAYHKAVNSVGAPTVILALTTKGYGTGSREADNTTHQVKKLSMDNIKSFRDKFNIPVADSEIEKLPYVRPPEDSPEIQYLKKTRENLGGFIPRRRTTSEVLKMPDNKIFKKLYESSGDRKISTTMAIVRIITDLLKDSEVGERIVPIVPDEARTFGMEGMFRQLGIYSSVGQLYEPQDSDQVMFYKEKKDGQILEEGINEAGSFSSWIAAATSYSNSGIQTIPFYIFYSMFGFQRIGDLAWAAGDSRSRGFLLGATAGRTTLNGEGLQHEDGHSHLLSATIPNCISYDPCFSYELAVIIQNGLERMIKNQEDVFYYITIMNENYTHPEMPKNINEDIVKGIYKFSENKAKGPKVQLMGSGVILREVIEAASILEKDFNVSSTVFSVTSFTEVRRNALDTQRWNMLNPDKTEKKSTLDEIIVDLESPIITATDYMKSFAEQIATFLPNKFISLGTDGFGRSDSREALRDFFEVDRNHIVIAALKALTEKQEIEKSVLLSAIKKYKIMNDKPNPVSL